MARALAQNLSRPDDSRRKVLATFRTCLFFLSDIPFAKVYQCMFILIECLSPEEMFDIHVETYIHLLNHLDI